MKADFEKGTKVCSKCKRELPIEMFYKDKSTSDGLLSTCKICNREKTRAYNYKNLNVFKRSGNTRGNNSMLKRDYELDAEQLQRRNRKRHIGNYNIKNINPYGILIWYDGKLNELDSRLYARKLTREYNIQRACAIRGYVARVKPSEHFLFDFDLEQMLKDRVCYGNNKKCITKWWKGTIRHWTVNDGIWKE